MSITGNEHYRSTTSLFRKIGYLLGRINYISRNEKEAKTGDT